MVSLLLGVGFSGWVYSKIYRKTGGNNQKSVTVAAASGLVAFMAMMIIMSIIT
jgi:hypothetical protein